MVGLVMSTYNGEDFIYEQLESLNSQTVKFDHVIIRDDHSSDNTCDIIENFIKKNGLNNWKLIRNEKNVGWKRNFKIAANEITDEYIFFSDQDDIWDKNKVKETISVMKENNALVVCSNYELYYSSEEASKVLEKERKKHKDNGKIEAVKKDKENFYIKRPGCTMCISNKLIEKTKKYEFLEYPHDAMYWKIAFLENSLYIINKPLIKWRRHEKNESTKKKREYNERLDGAKNELLFAQMIQKEYSGKITNEFLDFSKLRVKYLENKNIVYWIMLFRYNKYYTSFRSYIGDLYLCTMRKNAC